MPAAVYSARRCLGYSAAMSRYLEDFTPGQTFRQ
jgi:hypothetical protein